MVMNFKRIKILDTTLRDGEQAPGFAMSVQDKIKMAKILTALGVDCIEVGFPASSPDDFTAAREISASAETQIRVIARCQEEDIHKAGKALTNAQNHRIVNFIGISDLHLHQRLYLSKDQVIRKAVDSIHQALTYTPFVDFALEDASRADPSFLVEFLTAILEAGAQHISVCDTVGHMIPMETKHLFSLLLQRFPETTFSAHFHNDLGFALANSLVALEEGAKIVECTLLGIGERAGNTSLEQLAMVLHKKKSLGFQTNIQTTQLALACDTLCELVDYQIPVNKPIVGGNMFLACSGIHQDGLIKNRANYEYIHAEDIGKVVNPIVLSKHSGKAGVQYVLKSLGLPHACADIQTAMTFLEQQKGLVDAQLFKKKMCALNGKLQIINA